MQGRLEGKVALVTGAGSSGPGWGNGKATAVLFAREGAHVVAVDRVREAAEETGALIEAEGGRCLVLEADVGDSDAVRDIVGRAVGEFGRLDVLHNNVGIVQVGGPVELDEADWDRIVRVNMTSVYLMCKHALPHLVEGGGGSIVNIASVAGIRYLGVPYVAYAATKAGVIQMTQSIALEYAARGVRANVVLPGLMNTPMIVEPLKDFYADGHVEEMIRRRDAQCPMGRMGDAWDVARAALFLASDESRYITATQLVVDGGLTARC